jgi:iron(III) transport system substrate-binding protein
MLYPTRGRLFVTLATGIVLSASVTHAQAPIPDTITEAQLYEKAKTETGALFVTGIAIPAAKPLGEDFEKRYPGVRLDVIGSIVGLELTQRFELETKNNQHRISIMTINDYPAMKALVDKGSIAEWKVPTADRFPKGKIGNSSYSLYYTDVAVEYNEKLVTEEEAKLLETWEWAANPAFKGRFGVAIQRCSTCYAPLQMMLDPTMEKRYGWPFVEKMAANGGAPYKNTTFLADRVVAGEKDISWSVAEGTVASLRATGAPVRWKIPSPAPSFPNAWAGISKTAPHPYTARLFLNWITGEEGARALQKHYVVRTSLEGVADERAITKEPWYSKNISYFTIDWDVWAKSEPVVMPKWDQMISKGAAAR